MAFIQTFSAMIAASLVWMALFVLLGEADAGWLNRIADWISPLTIGGWAFFVVLCVACFLIAARLLRPRVG